MNKLKLLIPVIMLVVLGLVFSATAETTDTMTVYVDQANGLDTNDGLTETTAVKTMDAAYVLLNNSLSDTGTGTIVLVSDYTHTFAAAKDSISSSVTSHSYMVVIRGKTADTKFLLNNKNTQSYLQLPGPTTIEQLCIYLTGTNQYVSIHGAGVNGSLIIGEGVTNGDNSAARPSLAAVPHTGGNAATNAGKPIYMEINSGDWKSVYATSYTNDAKGDATLVLNGGTINKLSVRLKNTFTGDVRFELNGGTINELCPVGANTAAIVTGNITVVRAGSTINKTTVQGKHNGTLTDEEVPVVTSARLVLTVKYVESNPYTVKLYPGASGGAQITPTDTVTENGLTKYSFEGLSAGTYRTVVSRNGYYTITKILNYSAEKAAQETVIDVSTSIRKREGFEPTSVNCYSDEALKNIITSDETAAWWEDYAPYLNTPAFTIDRAEHQATTQAEMEGYIAGIDGDSDNMYVYSLGTSGEYGYEIPVVIFSATDLSGAETLEQAADLINANGKVTVHYQAQIHGNEPAAGEAALAMIGRLDTAYGDALLETVNIYVIPRLNPDGSYDYKRQVYSGLNANRDMLLAQTQEIAAHHKVYALFNPEVAIDSHEYTISNSTASGTYNDMMIASGHNGNSGDAFGQYAEKIARLPFNPLYSYQMQPSYYTNETNGPTASSGTAYRGMRGSISILLESRGIGFGNFAYERRVTAHLIAIDAILSYVAENHEEVQAVSDAERQRIVESGKTYEDTDTIVLAHTTVTDTSLSYTNTTWNLVTGEATRKNYTATPKVYVADVTRARPTAYVIPAGQSWTQDVLELMDIQDISYYYVEAGTAINLQQYIGSITAATLTDEQTVLFGKGAYVLPMNQRNATILALLMEPDIADELAVDSGNGTTENVGTLAQMGIIPANGESFPIYRYVRDLNAEGKVDTTTASSNVEYKVYVDSKTGSDSNDAYTEAAAAKTIEHAFAQLDALMTMAPEGTEGTVVFLDLYTVGSNSAAYTFPSHEYPVILTSKTGNEGIVKGGTATQYRWFAFGGDTTLDHITVQPATSSTYYYVFANGHKLEVKDTVKTPSYAGATNHFNISAGRYSGTHTGDAELTILGGTWQHLYMGGYTGSLKGNIDIVVKNAAFTGIIQNSYSGTTTGNIKISLENTSFGSDSAFYAGNANANNVVGNVTLTLGENVTLPVVYTGSRDAGNVTGTVTIVADGADMTGIEIIRGAKNTTGTVGKNVFAYKSGTVGPIVGYDEVQVYVDGAFHSVTAAMTKLSLKPSVTGFGYKAEFTADETIQSMIASQGYSLWMHEDVVISRTVSSFRDALTLRLQNFDIENYGSTKVNAKVFVKLSNGLVIETETVSYSMQDMVEMIDASIGSFTAEQIQAVKTMLAGYTAPSSWNIPNLKPEE